MFTPAFWSAIAAIFSAAAAILALRLNRQNRLEAVRPELAVAEWKRDAWPDRIELVKLQNLGRGPAQHVAVLGASNRTGNVSGVTISQCLIPIGVSR